MKSLTLPSTHTYTFRTFVTADDEHKEDIVEEDPYSNMGISSFCFYDRVCREDNDVVGGDVAYGVA